MSSDKIIFDSNFHDGVDQFPVVSPASCPVGTPRGIFYSEAHNGVSGCPLDSFFCSGVTPPSNMGAWSLGMARFINDGNNVFYPAEAASYPYIEDIQILPDGTGFYLLHNNTIYKYNLPIPYILSSAIYSGDNYTFSTGRTAISFLVCNSGNTLIVGTDSNIDQFSLTNYDITTTSFVATKSSADLGNSLFNTRGLDISPDGINLITVWNKQSLRKYTFGTAFQVSTLSYDNFSFTITSTFPHRYCENVQFHQNGSSVFVIEGTGKGQYLALHHNISEYPLLTNYDLSTISSDKISFPFANILWNALTSSLFQTDKNFSLSISSDGKNVFLSARGRDNTEIFVYAISLDYDCANCWDVTQLSYTTYLGNPTFTDTNPKGSFVDSLGKKLIILGGSTTKLHCYTISDYSLASPVFDSELDVSPQDATPVNTFFGGDYTLTLQVAPILQYNWAYVIGGTNNSVFQYRIDEDFDLSSSSYFGYSLDYSTESTDIRDGFISSDGNHLFLLSGNTIFQYSVNEFDLNTASYASISRVLTEDNDCRGIHFNNTGTIMLITGRQNNKIYKFTLPNNFDIVNAVYDSEFSLSGETTAVNGIWTPPRGDKALIASEGGSVVGLLEYDIT